jgi:hypothetical protein
MSNFEMKNYTFSKFPWLSKPVYLPLFQTAGSVEVATHAFLESAGEYESADDAQGRLNIVDEFQGSLDVTTWEAVSEAWELTVYFFREMLGGAHTTDVDVIVTALERWALSDDIYSCIKASSIQTLVMHVANLVSIIKGAVGKRRTHPVVTPEKRRKWAESAKTSFGAASMQQSTDGGLRKSISTGFLSALHEDDAYGGDLSGLGGAAEALMDKKSPTTRRFTKLQPFRRDNNLEDLLRDKVFATPLVHSPFLTKTLLLITFHNVRPCHL